MHRNKKIGISIPAYQEEKLIAKTLAGIPDFVDMIVVVDDGSTDRTSEEVMRFQREHDTQKRVILLKNDPNKGVGYSVVRGLKKIIKENGDIALIMAGDNQCNPHFIPNLLDPVIDGACDLAKSNRFLHSQELKSMPRFRFFGNIFITFLTKFGTGYYSIFDSQNGYGAIRVDVLKRIPLDDIGHRYEFENSYLLQLYLVNARIKDVAVPAIYSEETSTIRLTEVIPRTLWTIFKGFHRRLLLKYLSFNLHPIGLIYVAGLVLFLTGLGIGIWIAVSSIGPQTASTATVMLSIVPFFLGFLLLLAFFVCDMFNEPR